MRIFSILMALLVAAATYMFVFERETVLEFAGRDPASENGGQPSAAEPTQDVTPAAAADTDNRVPVVAVRSEAQDLESNVVLRGQTQAARQVEVRAETSGRIVSEPLPKGSFVEAGDLLCRIDPGTREVALSEAEARLSEARARVPEAEARLAEAHAAVPAAEARIVEAEAGVPAARASLSEAESGVPAAGARLAEAEAAIPAAEARLREAEARLPEAQAGAIEARARLNEAELNLNAARELASGGFAAETRVAAAEAAAEAARRGVQSSLAQIEGARAGVETARSQVEGARAGVETARGGVNGAQAAVETARSRLEGAQAAVKTAESGLEGARAGLEAARAGVQSAQSGIEGARAAVASAEREIEQLEIRAPFSGLLESDTAELGLLMQPGGLCATVIRLDPIRLVGFAPETDVDRIESGAATTARLASGAEVQGRVVFISRAADSQTRTFRVEVEVPNPDLTMRDGQTAEIDIRAERQSAHLLPASALTLNDEGDLGVRIVGPDAVARFAPVTLLRDTLDGTWVAGLPDMVEVIVVGQEFVTDGVAVSPNFREEATQ